MASARESSCHANPNFAVLCSFLDRYGAMLGLPDISYKDLQEWIEDTKNLNPMLVELHLRLLRKTGKKLSNVQWDRWEKGVVKFCRWYSNVDAWEIERFGYKLAKVSTKLTLLKNLSEYQFDLNGKFKDKISEIPSEEMRFQPIGRDKNGLAYWYMLDKDLNLRIYREDQDDVDSESWELVCRDRADLAYLISKLEKGEDIKIEKEYLSDGSYKSESVSDSNEDSCDSFSGGIQQYTPLGPSPLTIKSEPSEADVTSNQNHEQHVKLCLKLKIPKAESASPSKMLKDKFEREKGAEIKKKKCKIKDESSTEHVDGDGDVEDDQKTEDENKTNDNEKSNKDIAGDGDGSDKINKEIVNDSDDKSTDGVDEIVDHVAEPKAVGKNGENVDNIRTDETKTELIGQDIEKVVTTENVDKFESDKVITGASDCHTEKEQREHLAQEMESSKTELDTEQNLAQCKGTEQSNAEKDTSDELTSGKNSKDTDVCNIKKTKEHSLVAIEETSFHCDDGKMDIQKSESATVDKELEIDTNKSVDGLQGEGKHIVSKMNSEKAVVKTDVEEKTSKSFGDLTSDDTSVDSRENSEKPIVDTHVEEDKKQSLDDFQSEDKNVDSAENSDLSSKKSDEHHECKSFSEELPANKDSNDGTLMDCSEKCTRKSEAPNENNIVETELADVKASESDIVTSKHDETLDAESHKGNIDVNVNESHVEQSDTVEHANDIDGSNTKKTSEPDKTEFEVHEDASDKKNNTEPKSESKESTICTSDVELEAHEDKFPHKSDTADNSNTWDSEPQLSSKSDLATSDLSGNAKNSEQHGTRVAAICDGESKVLTKSDVDKNNKPTSELEVDQSDNEAKEDKETIERSDAKTNVETETSQANEETKCKKGMRRKSNSDEKGGIDESCEIPSKRPTVENDNEVGAKISECEENAKSSCTNVENVVDSSESTMKESASRKTTRRMNLKKDKSKSEDNEGKKKDKEEKCKAVTLSRKRKQEQINKKDSSDSGTDIEVNTSNIDKKADGDKETKREIKVASRGSKTPTKVKTKGGLQKADESSEIEEEEDEEKSDDSEDSDSDKTEDESDKFKDVPLTKVRGLVAASRKAQKRQADDSPDESPVEPASKRSKVRGRVTSRGCGKRRQPEPDTESTETSDSSDSDVPLARISGRGRGSRSRSSPKKPSPKKRPAKKKKIDSDEEMESPRKQKSASRAKKPKKPMSDDFPDLSPSEMGLRRSVRVRTLRTRRKSPSPEFIPSALEDSDSNESEDDEEEFSVKSKRQRKKKAEPIEETVPKGKNALRLEAKENKKVVIKQADTQVEEKEDDTPCCNCLKSERPEWILLCDKCDAGYHTACLRPPLMIVPDGDWFCPPCEHTSLVTKLQENLTELDLSLAKTDRLLKRKERLAYVSISLDNVVKEEKDHPAKNKSNRTPTQKEKLPFESDSGTGSESSGSSSSSNSRSSSSEEESELSDPYKRKKPKPHFVQRSCRSRNPISYKFEAYDELIMDAIEEDLSIPKEPKPRKVKPPGISRGKDMSNILGVSDEDESKPKKQRKRRKRLTELSDEEEEGDDDTDDYKVSLDSNASEVEKESDDYESEEVSDDSVVGRSRGRSKRRKKRGKRSSRFNDFVVDSDYDSEDDGYLRPTRRSARRRVNYRDKNSDESEESYHSSDFSDSRSRKKHRQRKHKGSIRKRGKLEKKRKRVVSMEETSEDESDEYQPSGKKKGEQKRRGSRYERDSSWSGGSPGSRKVRKEDKKYVRKETDSEVEGSTEESRSGSESETAGRKDQLITKKKKAVIKSDTDESDNDQSKSDKQNTSTEVEEEKDGHRPLDTSVDEKSDSESCEEENSEEWVETGESDNGMKSPKKDDIVGNMPKGKTKSPRKTPKKTHVNTSRTGSVEDQSTEIVVEKESKVKETGSGEIVADETVETENKVVSASDISPEKISQKVESIGITGLVKKKRGRKPKVAMSVEGEPVACDESAPEITPTKKKRGPRKKSVTDVKVSENDLTTPETSPAKKGRGRKKSVTGVTDETGAGGTTEVTPKKKRVRKTKGQEPSQGMEGYIDDTTPVKKKRSRKPKADDEKTEPPVPDTDSKPTAEKGDAVDDTLPEPGEVVHKSKEIESDKTNEGKLEATKESALNRKCDNRTDENSSSSNDLKNDSPLSARRQLNAPVGVVKPEVRQGVIVENKNNVDSKMGILPVQGSDTMVSPLQGMEKMTMGDPSQGMRGPQQGPGFGPGGLQQNYPGVPHEGYRHGFQAYSPQQSPGPYGPQQAHGPYPSPAHQGPPRFPQGPQEQGPVSPNSYPPSGQYGSHNMPPGYYQNQLRPQMAHDGQGMGGYNPHGYPAHGPQSPNYQQGQYPGYGHPQGPYQGMPMQGPYPNQPVPSQGPMPHHGPQSQGPYQGMPHGYPRMPQPRHPTGYNPNTNPVPSPGQVSPNQPLRPQSRHAVPHGMPPGPPSGPSNLDTQPRPQGMTLPVNSRRGFMMDSILKPSSKEPAGGASGEPGEGNMDEIQDIVNYVTNDKYFKEH